MEKKISYLNRDFNDYRNSLLNSFSELYKTNIQYNKRKTNYICITKTSNLLP